jgi:glycosyltransferase involved in cell wall biosynthesis
MPFIRVNALAGLGYGFSSRSFKARLIRPLLKRLLAVLLRNEKAVTLVQNPDDAAAVSSLGVAADRIVIVAGSGVDTEKLTPMPEPETPITVGFVGRLLEDKGVRTLIAAHDVLVRRGRGFRLLIAGDRDPANPASIPVSEIADWKRRHGIELLGHVEDIRQVWAAAHFAVLPSRREGLPKSLLEAAACGRPMVATDVPGCREIARPGINAILVPPDDPEALADAIERLATDVQLRRSFAKAGRELVEEEFSSARIGRETVELYGRLLGRSRLPPEPHRG